MRIDLGRLMDVPFPVCELLSQYCFTGGRTTWMVTVSDAVPPLPSSTAIVTATGPGWPGAVHTVSRSAGLAKDVEAVNQ